MQDVSDEDENIGESGDESDTDVVPNLQDLEIKVAKMLMKLMISQIQLR